MSEEYIESYIQLHLLGYAKSVGVWKGDYLSGGLYGEEVVKTFCGESMFSLRSNASKLALINLCKTGRYKLIDGQVHTPHLASLGAKMIGREVFIRQLKGSTELPVAYSNL